VGCIHRLGRIRRPVVLKAALSTGDVVLMNAELEATIGTPETVPTGTRDSHRL
jgi:hypothetical protein